MSNQSTSRQHWELSYLARQDKLIWTGVRKRISENNAVPADADFEMYIQHDLIKEQGDGYVISQKGRDLIAARRCPHCGGNAR